MAKAKKQDTTDAATPKAAAAKTETPAKKPPAAKKSAKAEKKSSPGTSPLIDTGLAAQTAAAMIANRAAGASGAASGQPESASFKNFKESLGKPAASLGGILGTAGGSKKFSPGFAVKKVDGPASGGRNQTFGADVSRASVPRRTGGG